MSQQKMSYSSSMFIHTMYQQQMFPICVDIHTMSRQKRYNSSMDIITVSVKEIEFPLSGIHIIYQSKRVNSYIIDTHTVSAKYVIFLYYENIHLLSQRCSIPRLDIHLISQPNRIY
jgi:hypothetical protein